MANFYSSQVTNLMATPPVRVRARELQGRMRYALGSYTNPASAGAAVADKIFFVRLPRGVAVLGHLSQLNWSTGTASSTANVGDEVTTARHLAATAITTAGVAVPQAATASGAAPFVTTVDTLDGTGVPAATNNCDIRSLIAGADVAASQVLSLHVAFVQD